MSLRLRAGGVPRTGAAGAVQRMADTDGWHRWEEGDSQEGLAAVQLGLRSEDRSIRGRKGSRVQEEEMSHGAGSGAMARRKPSPQSAYITPPHSELPLFPPRIVPYPHALRLAGARSARADGLRPADPPRNK